MVTPAISMKISENLSFGLGLELALPRFCTNRGYLWPFQELLRFSLTVHHS